MKTYILIGLLLIVSVITLVFIFINSNVNEILYDIYTDRKNYPEDSKINLFDLYLKLHYQNTDNYIQNGVQSPSAHQLSPAFNIIDEDKEEDNTKISYKDINFYNEYPELSIPVNADSDSEIEPAINDFSNMPDNTYPIIAMDLSKQSKNNMKLLSINQTSININLDDFLKREYPIKDISLDSINEPVVLILSTHATESYCETGRNWYAPAFSAERESDTSKNIVLVATELYNTLIENGVPAVQSRVLHDELSYQNSYTRSLETMEVYLKKYPSIKYIIDVHRDSIIASDGDKYKPTIQVNGKNCAQVMFVVGSDDGGGYHPYWHDNLTVATYLQQLLNEKYPTLMRPINIRQQRFNQHTTKGTLLFEVGSCGNSFDEALYAARLVGESFAELIKTYGKDGN